MLSDFDQPTKCWFSDALNNFVAFLQEGEDPRFTLNIDGIVIEIRLNKAPDLFDRDTFERELVIPKNIKLNS